jgi:hypothetical protein
MTKQDKLIRRLLSQPKDFTWAELVRLLNSLGYQLDRKGKTSGSRVAFWRQGYPPINLHRPHPGNVLKPYQIRQVSEMLRNLGLLAEEEQ